MRICMKVFCLTAWLVAAGTVIEARAAAQSTAGTDDCYFINGVWYCPCEQEVSCAPPDCVLIGEAWYCEENR